jgi:WD40 repeat protein
MQRRGRGDSGWPGTIASGYLSPATGAWMSEPPAGQDGGVLAAPPPRARRLVLAAVTGLALAVALAAAGVIIPNRQLPPRPVATLPGPAGQVPCSAAFSPGGTTLAVAGCGDSVSLWDIATRAGAAPGTRAAATPRPRQPGP